MNISDFFISQTRPIAYSKMPEGTWTIKDDRIELITPPPFFDPRDDSLTHKQLSELYSKHYENNYLGELKDNTYLVNYLSCIESFYLSHEDEFPNVLYELGHYRPANGSLSNRTTWVHTLTEDIYAAFLCYKFLIWEDDAAYSTLLSKILIPWNNQLEQDRFAYEDQYPIHEDPNKTCWDYLKRCSHWFGEQKNSINCGIRVKNGKLEEYIIASTLGEALLYQLFMHISMGKEGTCKKYKLANCELCHSPFVKKHGNARFCEKCSKNDVRVASHRSKRKEARNAQESNP